MDRRITCREKGKSLPEGYRRLEWDDVKVALDADVLLRRDV